MVIGGEDPEGPGSLPAPDVSEVMGARLYDACTMFLEGARMGLDLCLSRSGVGHAGLGREGVEDVHAGAEVAPPEKIEVV